MSKKISKALLPNLKEKINEVSIIPVDIDGEQFEIEVHTILSTALRDGIIKNIQLTATPENIDKYSAESLAFYCIFKVITDIDFGEDLTEGMDLFISLSDLGVITSIVEEVPEKMFTDIQLTLENTYQILEEMSKINEVS
jgi:hypothetical protein